MHDFLFALWFLAPIGLSNVAPILASKLPGLRTLNAPMDFGRTYRGARVLGANKTWRGLMCGIILGTVVLWAQQYASVHYGWAQTIVGDVDYAALPTLIVGPLFAIGALGGDALKSFFKRQRHLPPGRPWFPFDQIDIIAGALLVIPFITLTLAQYVWFALLCVVAQILFSYSGYFIGIKERPH